MRTRWIVGPVALFILPLFVLPLYAQSQIGYARRLADYGYFELASHQLKHLDRNEDTPDSIKSYLPVVRSYISMREAERREDPLERVKAIEEALGNLKGFINQNSNHPRLSDARSTYAETLRKAGRLWITIAKRKPEMKKEARESGTEHLNNAIKQYNKIAEEVEGFDRCLNKLNGVISNHELARLFEATGAGEKRFKRLKNVLGQVDDYLWSTCASDHDTLKIRARTYAALSHLELSQIHANRGNEKKAREHDSQAQIYFNSVTGLMDMLKKRQKMSRTKFTVINNLVLRAYKFWAESLYETGEREKALTKVENLQARYGNLPHPLRRGTIDPKEFEPGRALLLLKAKVLHEMGNRQQALDIAKSLTGWNGKTAKEADDLVSQWSEALGPEPLTPEEILGMVDERLNNGSLLEALNLIEKGRSKISSNEERILWDWKFLDRKALVYARMERWYESALMYKHLHERYHKVISLPLKRDNQENRTTIEKVLKNKRNDFQSLRDLVVRANYLAARSFGMLREFTDFEKDIEIYTSLLNHLSNEHPDSEWADKTVLLSGDLLQERGAYDKAIQDYSKPEKGTSVWEQGQVKIGYTYYQKGKTLAEEGKKEQAKNAFLNGVDVLRSYLKYLSTLDERTENQRNRAWSAVDTAAFSYLRSSVQQPDELLSFLDEYLPEFDFPPKKRARALRHRMNAYRQKGDHQKASEVAESLYNKYPDAPATTKALGDIAGYFEKLRTSASNPEQKQKHRSKEVSFYYRWISQKMDQGTASGDNVFGIAVKLREYGVDTGDTRSLKRARKLLNDLLENDYDYQGEPIPEVDIKAQIAHTLTELGELEEARKMYEQVFEQGGDKTLANLNGRARLYMKRMKKAKEEGNREKLENLYEEAKSFIGSSIIEPAEEEGEIWWKGWRTYIEVMLIEGSEQQKANKYFKQLRKRKNSAGEPFGGHSELFKELVDKYPGKLNLNR